MFFAMQFKLVAVLLALALLAGGVAQAAPPADPGPFLMSGTLTAIAADSISVTQRNQSTTIATDAATVFKLDGKVVTAADLKTGLAVGVWGTAGKPAVEVRVFTPKAPTIKPAPASQPACPFMISGTLTGIAADSISVTQRNQATKIATDAATVFKLDDRVVTVADLKTGLAVGVWGTAGKPAVEVHVFTPKPK